MQKIRLLVFSKFQILRSALRQLLALAPDIEIVGEAETPEQAEQALRKLHPDVILLETADATHPAISKLAEKTGRNAKVALVVLADLGNARAVRAMLRAGVSGYVLKQSSDAELLLAIRSAAHGRKFLDTGLIDQIALEGLASAGQPNNKQVLSKRERQVLMWLVQGYTSSGIARELGLSVKTVETYRSRIYKKVEVKDRADLMRYAISMGLISVNK
jgi:two-component system, NarL family, response regulator NreC